jgi:DNA invertase Pin-like site-specific DNA recombinase
MPHAYSYIRFSTPAQALGDSLRRQVERTAAYCAKHGLTLDESLRDEGLSGYHGTHRTKGALGRFMGRVKAGEIQPGSVLVVEALDRLSRQTPRVALNQFLDLINAGIAIVTLINEKRFDQASIDANVGDLFYSIGMMMGAHAESGNKGDRIKSAWRARRSAVSGVCPAWIRLNDDRTAFVVDEDRKLVVERIFAMCIDGFGMDRIAVALNSEAVPPFGRGKGWSDDYIAKIVKSRLVRGEMAIAEVTERGRRKTGQSVKRYPEVISEAVWLAANDAVRARHRSGGRYTARIVNLFSGLSVCALCGGRMRVIPQKGDRPARRDYHYLQCLNAKLGMCSNRYRFNYDRLEPDILSVLGSAAYRRDDQTAAQVDLQNRIALARRAADELETRYAEAFSLLASTGPLATKQLARLQADHSAKLTEVETLERALRQLSSRSTEEHQARVEAAILDMPDLTGDARLKIRQKLQTDLRSVIQKIMFGPDGQVDVQLTGPPDVLYSRVTLVSEPPPGAQLVPDDRDTLSDAILTGQVVATAPTLSRVFKRMIARRRSAG